MRRGSTLRLRVAIADDALGEAGDELGALLRKIAPSTVTKIVTPAGVPAEAIEVSEEFLVGPTHADDDEAYHTGLRQRLAELINSLCDVSLADALDIARQESARRSEGVN